MVFAWILIIIGIIAAAALVIYIEWGRDVSIPFPVISIIIASVCIGFGIHLFLISANI
ncbi:MAG: hypothetical protein ACTSWY_11025 [Promethearchaeota archaeon]